MTVRELHRAGRILMVAAFLAVTTVPLIVTLFDDRAQVSGIENRKSARLPAWPTGLAELADYPSGFADYYQDSFGLRGPLLAVYKRVKLALGDTPSSRVLIGSEGWLFSNNRERTDPVGDYRNFNVFSDEELRAYARHLQAKHLWLQRRGVAYLLVIAPNKHTVYPEHLPGYIEKVRERSAIDQIHDYLRNHTQVPFVDLRQPLSDAKAGGVSLYYQADTHWNSYGANVAQYEIAKAIAELFPGRIEPELLNPAEFDGSASRVADLSRFVGPAIEIEYDVPLGRWAPCGLKSLPFKEWVKRVITTSCKGRELKALIFRDSFFTNLQPYLSGYLRKAAYVWKPMTLETLSTLLDRFKPDVVIEQYVERLLPIRGTADDCFQAALAQQGAGAGEMNCKGGAPSGPRD